MKAYIQLDGIKGEVTDDGHEDWINVSEFHHGIRQETFGNTTGRSAHGTGVAETQEFIVTKEVDASTPNLNLFCASNKPVSKALLHMVSMSEGDTKVTYAIQMDNVIISSVQVAGSGGGSSPVPMETIALKFSKIKWTYKPNKDTEDDDGVEETQWDFKKGGK